MNTLKSLGIISDGNHVPTISVINQSNYINTAKLTAEIRENFTVPDGANIVMFSSTGDFYCLIGPSVYASIPLGSILDGSASELNPIARGVLAEDVISLISLTDCMVMMSFYI